MLSRLRWLLIYFLFWSFWFEGNRLLFLFYQSFSKSAPHYFEWVSILTHGYSMDLSVAGYFSVLPGLWLTFAPTRWLYPVINRYTTLLVIVVAFLTTVDLELYRAWGFRLDISPLRYLNTPKEAFTSASSSPLGWLVCILLSLIVLGVTGFSRLNDQLAQADLNRRWARLPALLATGALIIPIRGGFQQIPLNLSTVFFSPNSFANYSAINPQWNFIASLLAQQQQHVNYFAYLPEKEAIRILQPLHPTTAQTHSLLTNRRPNIMLIIWESFTAKSVASLGGKTGITPAFEKLSKEGLLFTQLYASGDRSDKGLIAALSGFPAQPTASIITIPAKASKLPTLSQALKKVGYHTAFYYGGETDFANIKSYLYHSEYDRIVSKPDFQPDEWSSKWGAHDHVVYQRILNDLAGVKAPFFTTFFTLSSHEPFDVPMPTAIAGQDEESLFLNSLYYADASLGRFIQQAKQQPWWSNTLVIILADHGHRLPVLSADKATDFHIPMLWLGGALKAKPQLINQMSSQTDLPATLLHQLGLKATDFSWSRDSFNPPSRAFAYFAFNNGFGLVQPDRRLIFDNVSRRLISSQGVISRQDIRLGQAYEELSYQDYLSK